MTRLTLLLLSIITSTSILAQSGTIKGNVTNSISKEPIAFVAIGVEGTTKGTTSDDNGDYTITGLNPGIKKAEGIGHRA